jgi:glycosyltransferase involved in cell wall biosynthesis
MRFEPPDRIGQSYRSTLADFELRDPVGSLTRALADSERASESAGEELRRAREQLAQLADVERELVFWRARAEAAEAVAAEWRTVQNRALWKVFAALDQMRAKVAPPSTRRERLVLGAARGAANVVGALGRAKPPPVEQFAPSGHKDVVFLYDEPGAWKFYRCDHQAEQLGYVGLSSDLVQFRQLDLVASLEHYDTFILNRVEWDEHVAALVEAARRAGKTVLFGTDDLIFEPDLVQHFAFLDNAEQSDRDAWRERLGRYRQTLAACDGAIVSTEPLARHAERHTSRVKVVYNTVSAEMVRGAEEALERRSAIDEGTRGQTVTIGYLSGTPSHNRDFAEAADAVVWALETYPEVRFLLVGRVDLDRRFDRFGARVMKVPKQRFHALATITARIDINLAPLERDNPFTECKSSVKFLEAGLLGVPTIASPRGDFVRVLEHGLNGLLAEGATAWQDALRTLIESPARRRELGLVAQSHVRERHTTSAQAGLLRDALASLATSASEDRLQRRTL